MFEKTEVREQENRVAFAVDIKSLWEADEHDK